VAYAVPGEVLVNAHRMPCCMAELASVSLWSIGLIAAALTVRTQLSKLRLEPVVGSRVRH